ncbi:Phage protein [hydrothermal vent metagenome]|uniref:Phage protein n=1 Tax=hydrothermal vent metagenome TaxID=652676 RepID=A0A3B0YM97_9ZZZZ
MGAARELVDKKALKNLVPLNQLSAVHLKEVTKKSVIEEVASGKFLFREGKRDSQTFYVLSGQVVLTHGKELIGRIKGGTLQAREALANEQPRRVSARTSSKCTIMRIDTSLLNVMLDWDQSSQYEVTEIQSNSDEDWMTKMLKSDLFSHLPAQNIQQMIMRMEEVSFDAGQTVINQNEDGDCYYVIKKGHCVVSRQTSTDSKPVLIAELHDGDGFGEEALISEGSRNASVTMITKGHLMRLSKTDFSELLQSVLVTRVNFHEGVALAQEGAKWLDVQLPGESKERSVPGSLNIPLQAVRDSKDRLNRKDTYLVTCNDGYRSASAVFVLGQMGFDAVLLEGGLQSVPNAELQALKPKDAIVVPIKTTPPPEVLNRKPAPQAKVTPKKVPKKVATSPPANKEAASRKIIDDLKNKAKQSQSTENLIIDKKANQAKITKLEDELQRANNIVAQQRTELNEVSEEKEKLNTQFLKLNDKVGGAQSEQHTVDDLHEQLEEMQYEHELERKQLEKEVVKHKKSTDKLGIVRTEIKELKSELKEQRAARVSAEKLSQGIKKETETQQTESSTSVGRLETRVGQLQDELITQKELRTQVEDELNDLKTSVSEDSQTTTNKIKLVNDELGRGREEYRDLQQRLSDMLSQKEALEREKLESNQVNAGLIEKQGSQTRGAQETISRLTQEVSTLQTELESNRHLLDSISGSTQEESNSKINEREKEFLDNLHQQQAKVKKLEGQNSELHELLKSSEKNIDKLKEQKTKIEFDWQAAETARTGLLEQHESEVIKSQEKLDLVTSQFDEEINSSISIRQKHDEVLDARDERIGTLQKQNDIYKQQVEKLSSELNVSSTNFSEDRHALQNEQQELKNISDQQKLKINEMSQLLDALENEKSSIEEAKIELQTENRDLDSRWSDKYEQQVSDFRAAKYRNDQLETELNIVKTDFEQGQKRLTELEDERGELLDQNQHLSHKHESASESTNEELKAARTEIRIAEREFDRERQASKAKISELEQGSCELEDDLQKYSELQVILEEKNQEFEEELNYMREREGDNHGLEKEVFRLKRLLSEAQSSPKNGKEGQGELYVELQQEMVLLKGDFDELQKKSRDVENDKRSLERELDRANKNADKSGGSKIKELGKINSRNEKDIESLKTDLALAKSSVTESETLVKGSQKTLKEKERQLQQLTLELRQSQQSSDQSLVLKEKIEDIKQDTKDQLKHYQYEYETMVQKGREENTKLRAEVARLHQQLQTQLMGSQVEVQQNVMPLDLPPASNDMTPLEIEDLNSPQDNAFNASASGRFTVPQTASDPVPAKVVTKTGKSTSGDRIFGAADDGADIFGEPESFREPVNIARAIIIFLILGLGAGGAYWYFVVYPTMQKEVIKSKVAEVVTPPAIVEKPPKVEDKRTARQKRREARRVASERRKALALEKARKRKEALAKSRELRKAAKVRAGRSFRDTLRDKSKGPLLISLPQASFLMGSKNSSIDINEIPRHHVRLEGFAISKMEVTFEQYAKFVQATGRSMPNDKDWGKGTRPVINVTWLDAVAYTKWISKQTGSVYRLPTEAEWEFAARAGTSTEYFWGNSSGKQNANCFDCGSRWDSLQTAPVARFKANRFGLHDVLGNVMEWTIDCYHPNYKGAPSNGQAWVTGACTTRVLRGGSYKSIANSVRSAAREHLPANTSNSQIGFRVVREL